MLRELKLVREMWAGEPPPWAELAAFRRATV